jgi:hypothetical protein
MHSLLTDPALCGWPPELVTVITNPVSAADMLDRIADLAEETTGALLVYYVGHGLLSPRGQLCLTVTSTRPDRPQITGLQWDVLADVIRTCPARIRMAILDCCFAGQAIESLATDDAAGFADITHIDGVYTLTATTRNRTAHVPRSDLQEASCTSFTGALRDLIQTGLPGRPARLTFSDIYPALRQQLRDKGLPIPSQRGTDTAQQFPFTANAALRAGFGQRDPGTRESAAAEPPPVRNPERNQANHSHCVQILTAAIQAAHTIPDNILKTAALARAAKAMATFDSDRATRLAVDAERIGQTIANEHLRAAALATVAEAVANTDLKRSERIAEGITRPSLRAILLARLAQAVAAADTGQAVRLAAGAERIGQTIASRYQRALVLGRLAEAVAASDPDRAEALAQAIDLNPFPQDELDDVAQAKAAALAGVAETVVDVDLPRAARLAAEAERIVPAIGNYYQRMWALACVADVAAADPAQAERFARGLTDDTIKQAVLAHLAESIAPTDPDRAEAVVQLVSLAALHAPVLARVAEAVAVSDPDRATRLAADAQRIAATAGAEWLVVSAQAAADAATGRPSRAGALVRAAGTVTRSKTDRIYSGDALANVVAAVAAIDPDHAERLTRSADTSSGAALARVAEAVAAVDPDRAERLIRSADTRSGWAPIRVAAAVAAIDPDRAERLTTSFRGDAQKALALAHVAKVVGPADPARAVRLVARAERMVSSSDDTLLIANLAAAVASIDPALAATLVTQAESKYDWRHEKSRARVAEALAAALPRRAEDIIQTITDKALHALTLAKVAAIAGDDDPARAARLAADAERTAGMITVSDDHAQAVALAQVAEELAVTAPDAAERIARSITCEAFRGEHLAQVAEGKAVALARVAEGVATADPGRAAQLVAEAEQLVLAITDEYAQAMALCRTARAVTTTDPDRAARMVQTISNESFQVRGLDAIADAKATALAHVARTVAGAEPDRSAQLIAEAEHIVRMIGDLSAKAAWQALLAGTVAVEVSLPTKGPSLIIVAGAVERNFEGTATRAVVQARVAAALTATDPDLAKRLISGARGAAQTISEPSTKDALFIRMAQVLAADPENAERIARSADHPFARATALIGVAAALAGAKGPAGG